MELGFSLNAVPLPGVQKKFPMWRDLALAMFNELRPSQPHETAAEAQARKDRFREMNPLRIASEYEAAFTRAKLDDLIRAETPDPLYKPGVVHQLLLKLPWSDVFTTNYDTLLERTELPGRAYQTVSKASELTTAFAPRIVKLHGSLPSQTPFIVSEEDYRTYPRLFAPFVNSVQQSLLEHSFVLVGFSGDDPNFLEWTGWIRDELGESHAPIYLVGPLSIDAAQRSLLARRGVTPIDLSPVFAENQRPYRLYAASTEWFLNCLSEARKRKPEWWPELDRPPVATPPGHPPIIDSGPVAPEGVGSSPGSSVPLDGGAVKKVVARWGFERGNYPGWLFAPAQKRAELWEETKHWIQPLTDFASGRPAVDRLLILYEINWRLEISAVPLSRLWLEPFKQVVDELFESIIEKRQVPPLPDFIPQEAASTPSVPDAWLQVAFAFLRDARERYDAPRWDQLKARIDKAAQQHPQHADRAAYEGALWAMWNVDRLSAKALLSRWQPSPQSPLAGMRKAGLLAEIDELGEAQTILRTALAEIRRALRNQGRNIELLSLEGWCSYLLFAIESSVDFTTMNFAHRDALLEEFRERWEELKASDCSPWTYKEYFDEALSSSPPKRQKVSCEIRGFDPGQVTLSTHWGVDDVKPYLPAFSYIRLHEQVGIPARLRLLDVGGECLNRACHWLAPVFGFGTLALLVRKGQLDDLTRGDLLTRAQVATMESALAKRLRLFCMRILERELNSLTGLIPVGSAQESTIRLLPEVLSRLAFRLEPTELVQDFRLALRVHQHFAVRSDLRFHQLCVGWFGRLFDAADSDLLYQWLPDLIRGNLRDEGISPMGPGVEAWSDPMRHFPKQRLAGLEAAQPELREAVGVSIDWLLKRGSAECGEGRRGALSRLINVYFAKLMTEDQQRELGKLLWSGTAANSLPDLPGVAFLTLLHLPAPGGIDVSSVVKNRILALPIIGAVRRDPLGRTTVDITGPEQPLILEASLASKPVVQLADEAAGLLSGLRKRQSSCTSKPSNGGGMTKKRLSRATTRHSPPWAVTPF